jgi:hypothetical protein
MYDVEDGVHLAAAKRLAGSSVKNLALFHYHPSQHVKRHPTKRIEADSSTEMYDLENGVHLPAAKRLVGSSVRNLALFHYATNVATANVSSGGGDDPVLTSSTSSGADRSTEMNDVEDDVHLAAANPLASRGVHLAAAERLARSSVKNLVLFHYYPS